MLMESTAEVSMKTSNGPKMGEKKAVKGCTSIIN